MQRFDHPVFSAMAKVPTPNSRGGVRLDRSGKIIYNEEVRLNGCPNSEFIKANNLSTSSHPAEWFEAFHPDVGVWTKNTNFKATVLSNAG
jgi:hypothetical protein